MEYVLIICTILGGIAAIGYFYEKFKRTNQNDIENGHTNPEAPEDSASSVHNDEIWENNAFYYAKNIFLKNISWDYATEHAKEVKIGGISGWSLPTLDELQVLRNRRDEFGIAEKYCYWSSERKGKNDAFYVHFDDGHLGNSPKSYNNGLCAIFTKTKKLSKDKSQF
jgi:hypothetical protein